MIEQRRHQRIRFGVSPPVRIGYKGKAGEGAVENLSMSGMLLRSPEPLEIGGLVGCEFSLFGSPLVDIAVNIVSRIGDGLYGARFQVGLINQVLIEDAIRDALASGKASVLSVHELAGRKVMRIVGGLNGTLRNDFMHALIRVGVEELDVGGVTLVEQSGLALCLVATDRHGVAIGSRSPCFAEAWAQAMPSPVAH